MSWPYNNPLSLSTLRDMLLESIDLINRHDLTGLRAATYRLGEVEKVSGNLDRAVELISRSRDLAIEEGDDIFRTGVQDVLAFTRLQAGQVTHARAELHDLVDHVLRVHDHTLNLQVLGTYVDLFSVLGDGHAAGRYHGAYERLKKAAGEEYPEDAFSENALAFARGTISDAEWEDARAYGATLTAEEALVEARDSADALGDFDLDPTPKP
jgi:hypothetical protein